MKKHNIPEQISQTLKEMGYYIRELSNGDILFEFKSGHIISIEFQNERKTSFVIMSKIGKLSSEHQYEIGLSCCINVNPTLLITKLIIEEEDGIHHLCAKINYACYSAAEAHKFISIALEFLSFAMITACEYMNKISDKKRTK